MAATRTAINAALALVVAALAAWLLLRPQAQSPPAQPLAEIDPAAAQHIRLERAGLTPLEFARDGGHWRLTAPVAARADDHKVERLLEVTRARATATFPAQDLAQYELESPAASLAVDGRAIAFGMVNPVTSQQYVLAGGAVHAVSPRYFAALPLDAADVISRTLLAPGETLAGIELPGVAARRGADGWTLAGAAAGLSRDDLNVWVDRWRHAIAAEADALAAGDDPRAGAALVLEDGRRVDLALERSPAGVLVTRLDERVRYRFPADVGAALLTPPGAAD